MGEPKSLELRLSEFNARHPSTKLTLSYSSEPPALVVSVGGDLDTQCSGDFQDTLTEVLEVARPRGGLILDLAGLQYISSTGVGALTALLIASQRTRTLFQLCRVSEQARSILEVLGFSSFFPMIDGYREKS